MVADLRDGTSATPPAAMERSPTWRMTFPGVPDQPARVRRKLAKVLRKHPDLDDILLVASELCTNAVVHTRSGHQGGTFSVEVTATGESLLVAVTDGGAPSGPRLITPAETDPHFRGLLVVERLSSDYGVDGDAEGRTVWALFALHGRTVPCQGGPC
jgi:anti-sigma regulatory factor (Ser/Thr protein kinase)